MKTATLEQTQELILLAKILSNPTRLKMLLWLSRSGIAMVSSFPRMLEGVSQPQASQNLKKFLELRLVTKHRVGKTWVYTLNQEKWSAIQNLIDVATA